MDDEVDQPHEPDADRCAAQGVLLRECQAIFLRAAAGQATGSEVEHDAVSKQVAGVAFSPQHAGAVGRGASYAAVELSFAGWGEETELSGFYCGVADRCGSAARGI